MSPPFWLSVTVAALVLLVLLCMASTTGKGDDLSWIWQIGLLLFAPSPLAFFHLCSKTAALWTTGGLALAILLLVVAADMNIPNGSRLPKILGVVTIPVSLLVLCLYKLFGLIAGPVFFVLRRFRN
jgi:hypothetical protein